MSKRKARSAKPKTEQATGRYVVLTPAAPKPGHPARFRMQVSKDLYADHSGRVHLPKWKWALVLPITGGTLALSPGYFDSQAEAERNAWGFTLFLAEAVRPLDIEVLR